MARVNTAAPSVPAPRTHEGAVASRNTPYSELRRTVLACLLWEDTFYESGVSVADRIRTLVAQCDPTLVGTLAIDARTKFNLRHVPLLLVRELLRHPARKELPLAELVAQVIQRPDELTELLAIYWQGETTRKKSALSKQLQRGIARAFRKFNAYQLAKYDRDTAIRLRDVLFLSHAKPRDEEQAAVWKQLVDGTLAAPDTWEVSLSGGADKRETWERLIAEKKLGALALLRNLRNMEQVKVPRALVADALRTCRTDRVLPFRFISAARHAPWMEPALEEAMLRSLADRPKLPGKTTLLVDGSGSMFGPKVSEKSELDRFDAAAALAILLREVCTDVEVIIFSQGTKLIPARRGFALRDALLASAERGGTYTENAKQAADRNGYDRLVIITDEQSAQPISQPKGDAPGYIVNVAQYQHGIGYGRYTTITGWSEAIVDYICAVEGVSLADANELDAKADGEGDA